MPQAGTTSELYMEQDGADRGVQSPPPPAAPTSVPPPTKVEAAQPVPVKRRMMDEKPDGTVRDTSSEAVTNPNKDLGFRNLDAPEATEPAKEPEAAPTPQETAKEPPPPAEPKVYAGKFKEVDALEKGYQELEKHATKLAQEKALLERERLAQPAPVPSKTPEQMAVEQAEANKILNEFVQDPKTFIEKNVVQRTITALTVQQIRNDWIKSNPDLAEHEVRVAFEANLLMQTDPELAKNPAALLNKATDNFRQFTGKIRSEGAKEALTQETRVIPLVTSTAPPPASEQPAQKAPLTADDAYAQHMRMLKEQEQRSHRGLRR